jgi:hypothetical protein
MINAVGAALHGNLASFELGFLLGQFDMPVFEPKSVIAFFLVEHGGMRLQFRLAAVKVRLPKSEMLRKLLCLRSQLLNHGQRRGFHLGVSDIFGRRARTSTRLGTSSVGQLVGRVDPVLPDWR